MEKAPAGLHLPSRGNRWFLLFLVTCLLSAGAAAENLVRNDIAYGSDADQRFNVYAPEQAIRAPVIFLVHGGGWKHGDKDSRRLLKNKLGRWLPRGFAFVTVNYRLAPKIGPYEQARDIALALAKAQEMAATWGGDRRRFILLGHSAGAHLVALLTTTPRLSADLAISPWLGSILLDSGALDVPAIMNGRHFKLHDQIFGSDPAYWQAASPFHQMDRRTAPILAVCSTARADSCSQAQRFVAKAESFGTRAAVLAEDLSHAEINHTLGTETRYTAAVEAFMRGLDKGVAAALR
jgi:arylformamidase